MKRRYVLLFPAIIFCALYSHAQLWSGVLNPTSGTGACSAGSLSAPGKCAIDWTQTGVPGGIPSASWTQCGSTIQASAYENGSSDATSAINAALSNCGSTLSNPHYVLLSSGTFLIKGNLTIPGYTVLRGAGTLSTILNTTGTSGAVITMGTGGGISSGGPNSATINSGNTAGSTSLTLSSTSGMSVGGYLMITELDDPVYVTIDTIVNTPCTFCDYPFQGARARGQIVEVENISGNTVTISPALYTNYGTASNTSPALATPVPGVQKYSGVELLQTYANNTGYAQTFALWGCMYCWVKEVFDNYTDGDHIDDYYGYRDEFRDSYFSNAMLHSPGGADSDVSLLNKTSGSLVENNILERLHVGVIVDWGSAGNVVGYNYSYGNFDSSGDLVIMSSFLEHGASPQFNLYEGNVGNNITLDSFWGSGSNETMFRNQFRGTDTLASPLTAGRSTVDWSSTQLANEQMFAITNSWVHTNSNAIGNVLGSADALTAATQGLYTGGTAPYTSTVIPSATRNYNNWFYAVSVGYDTGSDTNGSGVKTFAGGPSNIAGYWVGKASGPIFQHGNFDIAGGSIIWASGTTHSLPPSFYQSSEPGWFGSIPWPAVGPDVTGGNVDASTLQGHVNAIPAEACYNSTSRDSSGLLLFDPTVCYSSSNTLPPAPPTGLTVIVQ
jgi:hypothetical protein